MGNLSIRWRLTIGYGVILTAVLGGFAFFLYQQQRSFLMDNTASRLQSQADVALASVATDGPSALNNATVRESILSEALEGSVISAVLLDEQGEASQGTTDAAEVATHLDDGDYAHASGGEVTRAVIDTDPDRTLAVVVPVTSADGAVIGLLQVNGSLGAVDSALLRLQLLLTIGVVIAHLLGLTMCFAVTTWSLRPLSRLVETCRAIARGSYGERVALEAADDEIGQMGAAFNSMLDEVQTAIEQRERSERLTRQFAADASHELKSPLTVLIGYLSVLLRGGAEDEAELHRALTGMQKETDRMSRLVSDLVSLARLEAGGPVPRQDVDVAALVFDLREEGALRSRDHFFALARLDDATVSCDGESITRALRNLVENAIRHTPDGGTITLGAEVSGSAVKLTVADTGEGIAEEHLPYIFNRFYRVDAARARAEGSAGLGLAICRAIAEANGGTISASSRIGEGTTFTIELPLAEAGVAAP